jgi:serine-type D-Ala-D-Ala carboxypeptidase (penicillin-binding protein 5/6)
MAAIWRQIGYFALALMVLLPSAHAIETTAKQAFMMDAATGSVLLDKNGSELMHPSSMSKLMTIYVLFQRLKEGRAKLTDKFSVSEKAWRTQGSKTFVHVGHEVAIEDLIHGIIIQSGNDACIVVAEGLSGSEEAFAEELNRVAKEIGLTQSHFTNATGLPDENHLMTSRDLAILSKRLIEDFPEYYHYFAQPEYTYNKIKQANRNRLLGTLGIDGLKTGHTEQAGYGIALSAKQGERRLILVINGAGSEKGRVEEGDKLLRYGFREFENRTLLRQGQPVAEAAVWLGEQETVPLVAAEDAMLTLPIASRNDIGMTLKYVGPLAAPVNKNAHVADLVIRVPGSEPRSVKLLAAQDIDKLSGFGRIGAVLDHLIFNRQHAQ